MRSRTKTVLQCVEGALQKIECLANLSSYIIKLAPPKIGIPHAVGGDELFCGLVG